MSAGYIYKMSVYSMTVWRLLVCGISVCLMPEFEMSVCDLCLSVIKVCLGNDCVALISSFDCTFCARCLCAGSLYAEWLSSGCVSRISALYECLFRMSDCYVFVMGACRGLSVLYVCVYNVCLQDIYPRCLCIWWLFGDCGCDTSLCV